MRLTYIYKLFYLWAFIFFLVSFSVSQELSPAWQDYLTQPNAHSAKQAFSQAVAKDKSNPQSWMGLSAAQRALGNYNDAFEAAVQAVQVGHSDPLIELHLARAYELSPYAKKPELLAKACEVLAADSTVPPYQRSVASWYLSFMYRRAGKLDLAKKEISKLGFVTDYMVLGPFENEGKSGFATPYPPEQEISLDTAYHGKLVEARWFKPAAKPDWGAIQMGSILRPSEKVTGYILTYVYSPANQWAALRLGGSAPKVWINQTLVLRNPAIRQGKFDQDHAQILLVEGWNRVLVKTGILTGSWDVYLRITDPEGAPLPGLKYSVEPELFKKDYNPDLKSIVNQVPRAQITMGTGYTLEKLCVANPQDAMAFADLAYLYTIRRMHDENSQMNLHAIETALSVYPKSAYFAKIYADCQTDENLRRQFVEQAFQQDSTDLELLNILGDMDSKAGLFESAIQRYTQAVKQNPSFALPCYNLGIETKSKRWQEEAASYFAKVTATYPFLSDGYYQLANLSLPSLNNTAKIQLLKQCLAANAWYTAPYDQLQEFALNAGKYEECLQYAKTKLALNQYDVFSWQKLARTACEQKQYDQALDYCRQGLAVAPFDPELLKIQGLVYHRQGKTEEARKVWHLALEAKPNDVWLTEYLAFLAPESEKFYTPYRIPFEQAKEFSTDSVDLSQANLAIYLDQEIIRVYEDGNYSRYRHIIMKALSEDGAKGLGTQSLGYTPNSQKVELLKCRVIKPDGTTVDGKEVGEFTASNVGSRLYYDYLVKQYSFPGVEKGGFIDFEYKIDNTHQNIYGDYFGDMFNVGNYDPTLRSQYIVITPLNRKFYTYEERVTTPGVVEESNENNTRTYLWRFADLPYVEREPYMPAVSEVLPYIKISTFEKWDDVAKWYWGLIQDQFEAPQDLKDIVHSLTSNKTTRMDKVRALYDYTVTDIRYLGLEFGIGGYKPHKAMDICRTKYGDCKDKATLLITMLREIGIPADIVLIRTKDLGKVDYSLPSLGLFNHAIAHIPDLDGKEIWLDGTAMFCSMDEFPSGDQGRYVFCINSTGGTFRTTTTYSATQSVADYKTEIQLAADGSATGKRVAHLTGFFAPSMRYYFTNPAKIRQDVERQFNSVFPGTKMEEPVHSDFNDLNQPAQLSIGFNIPKLASETNGKMAIPGNFFPTRLTETYARRSERILDLRLPYPWTRRITTTYTLPAGYTVDFLPENLEKEYPFGKVSIHYTRNGNTVAYSEEIQFYNWELEAKDYAALRAFCNLVDRKEEEKIILKAVK